MIKKGKQTPLRLFCKGINPLDEGSTLYPSHVSKVPPNTNTLRIWSQQGNFRGTQQDIAWTFTWLLPRMSVGKRWYRRKATLHVSDHFIPSTQNSSPKSTTFFLNLELDFRFIRLYCCIFVMILEYIITNKNLLSFLSSLGIRVRKQSFGNTDITMTQM
jgi:hypothetical protein